MESFFSDIRYGLRSFVRSPGLAAVIVFTLALGIGANTAIFSALNAIVLRSLPFAAPERLVVLRHVEPSDESYSAFSPADYLDVRRLSRSFEELAGHRGLSLNLGHTDGAERIRIESVSPSFFKVFGIEPLLGRLFLPEGTTAARVVVLSYGTWQSRFGGDPSIVGSVLSLNGEPHEVVGVTPAFFRYPASAEMWVRSYRDDVPEPPVNLGDDLSAVRDPGYFTVLGRLAAEVPPDQAQAEMNLLAARLAEVAGDDKEKAGLEIVPLHEELFGNYRPVLLLLLGAVGLVLLIACANVANLLLARSKTREREVAIRMALGASRSRLVRQLLSENVLIGLMAGALGLVLAIWGVDVFVRLAPMDIPRASEIELDGVVLSFALGISLLTGVVFGLLPALQFSKPDLHASLKEGGRAATEGSKGRNHRRWLVVSEVALSLLLLCAAGLLMKSLVRLLSVDPGFRSENLLTMRIDLSGPRYSDDAQAAAFVREVTERINDLPGVLSAGTALAHPFSGMAASFSYRIEGRPVSSEDEWVTEYQTVSPGYFRTMGIPLLSGRALTDQDDVDAPRVVVINECLARLQWPGEDPIGKRIAIWSDSDYMEIVGVVGDVRHFALERPPRPEAYVSYYQYSWPFLALVVRTDAEPSSLVGAVRDQILSVDEDQAVYAISTMNQVIARSTRQRRFTVLLVGIFTLVALVLALVGLYAVMSDSVSQRLHEIGIRMALGARPGEVLQLVMGWGLKIVLQGIAVGLAASLAVTHFLSGMLFGISPVDPVILAGVALLFIVAAALAAYLPAHRASRVDPVVTLRCE